MSDDTIGGGQLSFVNVTRAEKRGNPINSQEKKRFLLGISCKKRVRLGKKERKSWVDFWDGSSLRRKCSDEDTKNLCHQRTAKIGL